MAAALLTRRGLYIVNVFGPTWGMAVPKSGSCSIVVCLQNMKNCYRRFLQHLSFHTLTAILVGVSIALDGGRYFINARVTTHLFHLTPLPKCDHVEPRSGVERTDQVFESPSSLHFGISEHPKSSASWIHEQASPGSISAWWRSQPLPRRIFRFARRPNPVD